MDIPNEVVNKKLYESIKAEAKQKYKRFPSLYASAWIAKTYKERGGKYKTDKPKNGNIDKWFNEEWVQIIPYMKENNIVPCGDNNKDTKACRPLKRINKNTPSTMNEIVNKWGKKKVIELAEKKNNSMDGRLDWKNGTFKEK